jgi:tetratricopeptide (TPR) repeat protein
LRFSSAELTLLEALTIAQASMGAYGDDMMLTLQRGLEVSQRLGDDRTSMHLSAGLHLVLLGTGRFAESLRVAEQYAVLAKNRGGASERVIAHWMIGASRHYMGEHIRADAEFAAARRGLAQSSLRKLQYFDSKALLNANLGMARTKLALGCPSQALQLAVKAIEEAREYPDSLFPCVTLFLPIFLLHDLDSVAAKLIESLEQVSPEYRVGFRLKNIEMMKGLLLAQRGDHVEAELRLRGCIDGVRMTVSRFIALQALSDVLRVNGKPAEAFACIEEAIALSESSGGRYAYPDLLRTKAEVMMDLPQFSTSQVRGLLVEAAEDARESGALGWEVAIATTLARFERANERSHEATSMLQEVYSRFSEGHETRLLRQAMATLSTA